MLIKKYILGINGCGFNWGYVFFTIYYFIFTIILMNLLIVIIIYSTSEAVEIENLAVNTY